MRTANLESTATLISLFTAGAFLWTPWLLLGLIAMVILIEVSGQ